MTSWPLQKDCDRFYGNPRGANGGPSAKWESENLVSIRPPYRMTYAGKPITGIRVHKKCAESLKRVLNRIWESAGKDQATVDRWGASIYGGAYNYRLMRGGNALSMHSWGCAIDLDPARNGLGDQTPHFANVPEVLDAFAAEGWEWGGDWSRRDGMHWQASWTRARPARVGASTAQRIAAAPPNPPAIPESSPAAITDPHQVSLVQTWLRNLGYTEIGTPDGKIGPYTRATIAAYRLDKGLPPGDHIDDELVLALAKDREPRVVAPERANADAARVASVAPEARPTWCAKIWSGVTALGAGTVAVGQGVVSHLEPAREYIAPVQTMLSDVPSWVWFAGAAGIAFYIWRSSRKAEQAITEAVQTGARR